MKVVKILGVSSVLVVLIAAFMGFFAFHELRSEGVTPPPPSSPVVAQPIQTTPPAPQLPELAVGESINWTADSSFEPLTRQAGPYVLEISKREQDGLAAPVLKLSAGSQSITLEGEMAAPSSASHIVLFRNRVGAAPVIMLQSFTGGAHCCNHVQLAGFSDGKLKAVDLGSFDGDQIDTPIDVSGDGVADFVLRDNRFLYGFAPYAQSYAPPEILNVARGKVIDVSRNPKFKSLFEKEMRSAGENCQPGLGNTSNGACASFVAASARLGRLDQAWAQMLVSYDASVSWTFPTGCWVSDVHGCPAGQEITFKSYPEALEAFLRRTGYIPLNWIPPERRQPTKAPPQVPVDHTA